MGRVRTRVGEGVGFGSARDAACTVASALRHRAQTWRRQPRRPIGFHERTAELEEKTAARAASAAGSAACVGTMTRTSAGSTSQGEGRPRARQGYYVEHADEASSAEATEQIPREDNALMLGHPDTHFDAREKPEYVPALSDGVQALVPHDAVRASRERARMRCRPLAGAERAGRSAGSARFYLLQTCVGGQGRRPRRRGSSVG